jgi:hypothetical protein
VTCSRARVPIPVRACATWIPSEGASRAPGRRSIPVRRPRF